MKVKFSTDCKSGEYTNVLQVHMDTDFNKLKLIVADNYEFYGTSNTQECDINSSTIANIKTIYDVVLVDIV